MISNKKRKADYIDFADLGLDLSHGNRVDFTNAECVRELTCKILSRMGITLNLPATRALCPAVPNRLNYLHWLDSILSSAGSDESDRNRVLDVGTGSTCIYPLLGNRMFGWHFVGADISPEALSWAAQNVALNAKQEQISLLQSLAPSEELQGCVKRIFAHSAGKKSSMMEEELANVHELITTMDVTKFSMRGPLRHALGAMDPMTVRALSEMERNTCIGTRRESNHVFFSAVMCNPPFYDVDEVILENRRTVCTGSNTEMRTTGGEVAFIIGFIADSLVLQGTICWYTCMLGKKRSLGVLVLVLQTLGIASIRSTRFELGITHRWGLAWSTSPPPIANRYLQHVVPPSLTNPRPFSYLATDEPEYGKIVISRALGLAVDVINGRIVESLLAQNLSPVNFSVELRQGHGGQGEDMEDTVVIVISRGGVVNTVLLDRLKGDIERINRRWRRSELKKSPHIGNASQEDVTNTASPVLQEPEDNMSVC